MSSRELWVLIRHLPDDSATKKAMREGDWTEEQYINARLVNEIAYFRADHAAIHASHKMRVEPLESPAQRAERAEQDRARADIRSFMLAQLHGEYTPPRREVTFEHTDTVKGGDHV